MFPDPGHDRRANDLEKHPIDFRQLAENSGELIIVLDAQSRCAYANPTAERLLGLPAGSLLGRVREEIALLDAGSALPGQAAAEFEANDPASGLRFHVRCISEHTGGGTIVLARLIAEAPPSRPGDTTSPPSFLRAAPAPERDRAENRLRRLFDSRVIGIIFWDLDTGLITDANDTFLEIVGFDRDDLAAGRLNFRTMTPPEWTERNEQGVTEIRSQGSAPAYEKEYFRKDGSRVPILIGGTRFEESGTQGFSFVIDITEQRRLQQEQERLLAEAQARAAREALINTIGGGIRQSLAPDEIERAAVAALGRTLAADRCYLMTVDIARDSIVIARDWCAEGVETIAGQYRVSDMGVEVSALFAAGKTLVVADARPESERRLSDKNAATNERVGVSAFLNVPFYEGDRIVGALGVAMAGPPREWMTDEVSLAETVAGQLRSALETARLQQRERNIAHQLQDALQPTPPASVPGLTLGSYYRAALAEAEVGGDFHDTFPLDDTRSVLVVADLSGKGLSAASQVAAVRNQLRYALYTADLSDDDALAAAVVARLNAVLVRHSLLTGFATVFVGIWDATNGALTYVNAGQEPALVWRAATGHVETLPPTGPVLGGFVGGPFSQDRIVLRAGDIWLAFSDGMTEVGPSRKELLGIDGVIPLFAECCKDAAAAGDSSPDTILTGLIARVESFARGTGMRDDLCALIALCGGGDASRDVVRKAIP